VFQTSTAISRVTRNDGEDGERSFVISMCLGERSGAYLRKAPGKLRPKGGNHCVYPPRARRFWLWSILAPAQIGAFDDHFTVRKIANAAERTLLGLRGLCPMIT